MKRAKHNSPILQVEVSAALGGSASELFTFQNPFLFPLRLHVDLRDPLSTSDIRDGTNYR